MKNYQENLECETDLIDEVMSFGRHYDVNLYNFCKIYACYQNNIFFLTGFKHYANELLERSKGLEKINTLIDMRVNTLEGK